MKKYDVVIVGAGPAGLAAGKVLAENGKEVTIIEKDPIPGDKVCAGGLTMRDIRLGIPEEITERKYTRMIFQTERQRVEVERNEPIVYTVNRKKLGAWQKKQAEKAGVNFLFKSKVKEIHKDYIKTESDTFGFNYLIGADGANSIVRKFVGIKTDEMLSAFHYIIPKVMDNLEMIFDPTRFGMTYLWIFPHKNCTSVGTGIDIGKSLTLPELKERFHIWLKEKNIDISKAKFEAAPINYDYEGHEFGNIFLIGDAGGFTSGLTGEGIASGILSGEEIAKKILNPGYKQKRLRAWLRYKQLHDNLLKVMELNNITTEIIVELGFLLVRIEFLEDIFLRFAAG